MTRLENARVLPLVSLFWLLGRFKSANVPRKDVIRALVLCSLSVDAGTNLC